MTDAIFSGFRIETPTVSKTTTTTQIVACQCQNVSSMVELERITVLNKNTVARYPSKIPHGIPTKDCARLSVKSKRQAGTGGAGDHDSQKGSGGSPDHGKEHE